MVKRRISHASRPTAMNVPERMQRINSKVTIRFRWSEQFCGLQSHEVYSILIEDSKHAYTVQKYAAHDATCITKMLGALYPSLLIA